MIFQGFLSLPPERLIVIYGFYSFICVLFLVFAVKLYRRGQRSQHKAYIVKFFLYVVLGLFLNILYAPVDDIIIQELGNKSVIFLTTMGIINLVFFTYTIFRSTQEFAHKKSMIAEAILACIAAIYFILPIDFIMPGYSPYWPELMVSLALILTQSLFVIAIGLGIIIVFRMTDSVMKKRFWMFLVGLLMFEMVLLTTILRNGQLIPGIILLIFGLFMIPGGIFVYLGVGKNIK